MWSEAKRKTQEGESSLEKWNYQPIRYHLNDHQAVFCGHVYLV